MPSQSSTPCPLSDVAEAFKPEAERGGCAHGPSGCAQQPTRIRSLCVRGTRHRETALLSIAIATDGAPEAALRRMHILRPACTCSQRRRVAHTCATRAQMCMLKATLRCRTLPSHVAVATGDGSAFALRASESAWAIIANRTPCPLLKMSGMLACAPLTCAQRDVLRGRQSSNPPVAVSCR